MTKLEGFLFGHYDSRGGASFIEADSKEKAYKVYESSFCLPDEEVKEYGKEICDEDFLGAATIESEHEISDGMELEQAYVDGANDNPLWVKEDTGSYQLRYGGECPEGFSESELGEDAFGVIVMRPPYDSTGAN